MVFGREGRANLTTLFKKSNLWVRGHRARLTLRWDLETKWFTGQACAPPESSVPVAGLLPRAFRVILPVDGNALPERPG